MISLEGREKFSGARDGEREKEGEKRERERAGRERELGRGWGRESGWQGGFSIGIKHTTILLLGNHEDIMFCLH